MVKEKSKILVRDTQTQQVLYSCDLQDSEKAWKYAAEMEEMGLDVEIITPTLGETLSHSLGLSQQDLQTYRESMEEEIDSHEGSCCFKDEEDKLKH